MRAYVTILSEGGESNININKNGKTYRYHLNTANSLLVLSYTLFKIWGI